MPAPKGRKAKTPKSLRKSVRPAKKSARPAKKSARRQPTPPSAQPATVGNPWPDGLPSAVVESFWISVHTESPIDMPLAPLTLQPEDPIRRIAPGGKWLLFVDRADVDRVWSLLVPIVKKGLLGPFAKVATARPNPLARDPNKHVICVYTSDAENRADVFRVRDVLRQLGFTSPISYKTDAMTLQGKYEGSGRIAKYRV